MPRVRPVAKPISLNEEQTRVVAAQEGCWQVLAGPGAGKTQAISMRYASLIQKGVSPNDILSMSFTRTAAANLRNRVEEQTGKLSINRKLAGASTYHSFALNFILEERNDLGIELAEFPLAPELIANRLSAKAASRFEVNPRSLRASVSLQKRNQISPSEAIRRAESSGKSSDIKLALAYKEYDKLLRGEGVLDFDGLMEQTVALLTRSGVVRNRHQFLYVMADESQDNSKIEWDLLKLLTQKHGNLLCVGDVSQCQPPETMVAIKATCIRHAKSFPLVEKPISELQTGDKVITWSRRRTRVYVVPRSIEVASRQYSGPMLTMEANGRRTRMTPDHQVWVKNATHNRGKFVVYLMWKEGYGFRIGKTTLKNQSGSMGICTRSYTQETDKGWVLGVYSTKEEALHYEDLYSLQFNLPQRVFPSVYGKSTDDEIRRAKELFNISPNEFNGQKCLDFFGLLLHHPFFSKGRARESHATGFFKTAACNILPGLMNIPLPGEQSSALITKVEREEYNGPVYSLNVADEHTYVADGLVVSNCIYGFRGSDADLFANMSEIFPGTQTLFLSCNYRSTPEIIDFIRPHAQSKGLAEKFHTPNSSGPVPRVIGFNSSIDEATWVVNQIRGVP